MPKRRKAGPAWTLPSARVRELIRKGAQLALTAPPEWLEDLDEATLGGATNVITDDPTLVAAIRRTNRANLLHWATANVRAPGEMVEPNVGDATLSIARDIVRRGAGEAALDAYRTGQNAAWMRWMQLAFQLTDDVQDLRELLEVTSRSISTFIDATIRATADRMTAERAELTRGTHAERREVVSLILGGAPIGEQTASRRLGYRLDQPHRAAIVWSDEREPPLGKLEALADAFARAVGAQSPLTVIATGATLWVWATGKGDADLARIARAARGEPALRIAIGSAGEGIDGFRRSHLDALTAQRMVARIGSPRPLVSFDEVRLVSLATHDVDSAEDFVHLTLGPLESAGPELRTALLAFLREGCHASRTAKRLRTHRNTLLRRLARAEELLPRPLAEHRIDVAVALEIVQWRGPGGESNRHDAKGARTGF
jgi:DNA-binding PucR family transcriptional regulator